MGTRIDKRVLVTGASGFLGAQVVRAFSDGGWHTFAGIRQTSDNWRLHDLLPISHLSYAILDLTDLSSMRIALHEIKPSVVVHCAAYGVDYRQQDTELAIRSNVLGTASLVEMAAQAGVERYIHVGTCYEYGDYEKPIQEDFYLRPSGIYGSTKAAGTILSLDRANSANLPLVVVRPFGMYGPLEGSHKFVPQVIKACLCGSPLDLTAGEQVRDYIYVDDVANVCMMLAEGKVFPAGEIFNLGSGQAVTIRMFGEMIADQVGRRSDCLFWGKRSYRKDEIMYVVADISKAKTWLSWSPSISLREGLQKTVEFWIREGG